MYTPIITPTIVGIIESMNPPIPADRRPLSTKVMNKRVIIKTNITDILPVIKVQIRDDRVVQLQWHLMLNSWAIKMIALNIVNKIRVIIPMV